MTGGPARTALVVVAGEAERAVGLWRQRFDPEAVVRGIPAHITILFPFVPALEVDAALLERLRALYAPVVRFSYALASVHRFPTVAWLAPDPATPFVSLIERTLAIGCVADEMTLLEERPDGRWSTRATLPLQGA